nr:uncharacterized protein K02A2.6-like [Leptinotarsa decemlineata]
MNRYYAHVKIEGQLIKFEVDSGSAYTFLQRQQLQDLNLNIPLEPATMGFRSFTQDVFIPDGEIVVNVSYGNIKIKEDVYIVPDNYAAILGRVWIRRLKIDLNQLSQQNTSVPFERFNLWSVEELSAKYPNVFEEKIGCVPGFNVVLKLREGVQPCFHREREIPYALSTLVEKELDALENAGIITKISISDWGSPLVVIPKADGGVRLAVDYKVGVNERLMNSHYPIRKIEDILNSLRNSRFFYRLDSYKAYLHIKVDEKSSEIQTITTHRGTYKMNRLSSGIKTAPSEFNRIMDQISREMPKTEFYFDDIVVHRNSREECATNLNVCFDQLQKYDLHLNICKCKFFQDQIEFLGHVIKFNSKSPEKVAAIINMAKPTSVEELRRFLGMVTYYARFIPNN